MNVLYLDSSKMLHNIMSKVVTECGHTYIAAFTLTEGAKSIESEYIDLIIMGLEFPDGNSFKLIRSITKKRKIPIPVIVMSSNFSVTIRKELFELGIFDYILKSDLTFERFARYFNMIAKTDEVQQYLKSLKIAVLDDSQTVISFVKTIFELNSLTEIVLVSDPVLFLESTNRFDLYIIDYILPGISGDAVISAVRRKNPEAIIICMSAISNDRTLSNVLMAGADDYITKPFDANIFMARIKVNIRSYLLNSKLKKTAITDGLTGAFNHAHSFHLLENTLRDAEKNKTEMTVLMLDMDDFKKLNDAEGHQAGDEALMTVAKTIQTTKRENDIFGRYGGEEFVMILPETGLEKAVQIAEEIRQKIELLVFSNPKILTTVSIGVAVREKGDRSEKIIGRADEKLYEAKRGGKNRVAV